MTQLLPIANTAASSASFVLAAGDVATVFLVPPAGAYVPEHVRADIEIQSSVGWVSVGALTKRMRGCSISTPGTYRVTRVPNPAGQSCGVERA